MAQLARLRWVPTQIFSNYSEDFYFGAYNCSWADLLPPIWHQRVDKQVCKDCWLRSCKLALVVLGCIDIACSSCPRNQDLLMMMGLASGANYRWHPTYFALNVHFVAALIHNKQLSPIKVEGTQAKLEGAVGFKGKRHYWVTKRWLMRAFKFYNTCNSPRDLLLSYLPWRRNRKRLKQSRKWNVYILKTCH